MLHLYSILVKPKYNVGHVKAINTAFKKYISFPFTHTCLTDDTNQFNNQNFCNVIDIQHHDLPTFWNKMLFFKKNEICTSGEKCIFFDLDSMILNDLTPILDYNIDDKIIIGLNPSKIYQNYITNAMNHKGHGRHLTIINSSFMMWTGGQHHKLWDKFYEKKDDHIINYYGNDEFITFEYSNGYQLIDKKWVFGVGSENTAVYSNKIM